MFEQGNIFEGMFLKLNFEVLYRRVFFVKSIVYYFSDQNRGIPGELLVIDDRKFTKLMYANV